MENHAQPDNSQTLRHISNKLHLHVHLGLVQKSVGFQNRQTKILGKKVNLDRYAISDCNFVYLLIIGLLLPGVATVLHHPEQTCYKICSLCDILECIFRVLLFAFIAFIVTVCLCLCAIIKLINLNCFISTFTHDTMIYTAAMRILSQPSVCITPL